MSVLLALGWFFHPLHGDGYQFWSGIGSDFGELTIVTGVVMLLRHRNCHVRGCWRLGHADPEHGHPACRHHHSRADLLGTPCGEDPTVKT